MSPKDKINQAASRDKETKQSLKCKGMDSVPKAEEVYRE